jgi:hypothetical protein
MKGKMTIVLLGLVLVFGMIAASCDNDAYTDNPYKSDPNKSARDWKRSPIVVKAVDGAAVNISSYWASVTTGDVLSSGTPGALAGTPLQTFVGASTLTKTATGVTITTGNSWGGGLDMKIGTTGADAIPLNADAKVTVKTAAAGATGTWVVRLKTNDYNGGSDTAITPGTDCVITLSAADLDKIAGSDTGCIRINTSSASGSTLTVTEVTFQNYRFFD